MLNRDMRIAILTLAKNKVKIRQIARELGIGRKTVKRVLLSGEQDVPRQVRLEQLTPHLQMVRDLFESCEGNRVRVHEELHARKINIAYTTLTDFCRRNDIGVKPKVRTGHYHFDPGQEMQHDTSPHKIVIGDQSQRTLQCASLVLCYSRMIYTQVFERWTRLECRHFLTEALQFFGGSCQQCMIDNSSVVIAHGSGASAQPATEMEALGDRFGFKFIAHAVGDANRSARVERPFHYIENNFYVGRQFTDLPDLNTQLLQWCHKANGRIKRHLHASPIQLFAAEKTALRPLPLYIPPIYALHNRRVTSDGYISLHNNRYSVSEKLIGRMVEVREKRDEIEIYDGPHLSSVHERRSPGTGKRFTLPEHRRQGQFSENTHNRPERKLLAGASEELAELIKKLEKHHGRRLVRPLRHLYRIYMDYPLPAINTAVQEALQYGLLDLFRIEKMILRELSGQYFLLPESEDHPDESETENE